MTFINARMSIKFLFWYILDPEYIFRPTAVPIQSLSRDARQLCYEKGQERPHLIELTGAGLYIAWTTTTAFALNLEARQNDYVK